MLSPKTAIASGFGVCVFSITPLPGLLLREQDVLRRVELVDALHRADVDARPVLHVDARLGDDRDAGHAYWLLPSHDGCGPDRGRGALLLRVDGGGTPLPRQPGEARGPSAADYTKPDTVASLAMGVGSLLAPFAAAALVKKVLPGKGRFPKVLVRTAVVATVATTVADRFAQAARTRVGRLARRVARVGGPVADRDGRPGRRHDGERPHGAGPHVGAQPRP